jgi:uncharacterized phage infection (PIP) family protein YhgE
MPKTSVELNEEGFKAYKELMQYLKTKYGKARGLIGLEVGKAIMLYVQQLKGSEGSPQSPQIAQQKPTEAKTESKPVEYPKTTKGLKQEIEGLAKRNEDLESLKQEVENIKKELKATEDTVRNIAKLMIDTSNKIGDKIDDYVKIRLNQVLRTLIPQITQRIAEDLTKSIGSPESLKRDIEDLKHDFKQLFHDTKATYSSLKEELKELKNKLNEVIDFINKEHGEHGGLFSNEKKPAIQPLPITT